MDANIYETSGRPGQTFLSAWTDEIEGELEKRSIFGIHITRKVIVTILGLVVGVSVILGVSLSTGSSIKSVDVTTADLQGDHEYWSLGSLIESAVGKKIYDEGTDQFKALVWLSDLDPLGLDSNSPMEEVIQRFVIMYLFYSTGGDQWRENKYRHFLSKKSVCDWNDKTSGVFCNENDQVTAILMPENHMSGTIPHDIGLLSNLERLNLTRNILTGTIPASIGIMSSMTNLDLSMNEISGSIPKSIGMLIDLVHLNLSFNSIGGSDDIDLINALPNLEEIYLNHNLLEGKIGQFGRSGSLRVIDMSYNSFDGTLSTKVPDGHSLNILRINDNLIKGTIPGSFGHFSNLVELDMSDNEITGSLPSNLGDMASLEIFKINNNQISYGLPVELENLYNLTVLEVSGNDIESIPKELFSVMNLEILNLSRNNLKGSLPSELGLATSLVFLDLSNNKFSNKLPTGVTNLHNIEYFYLNDNLLDGSIPTEINDLHQLRELDISNTNFFGSMGSQFCGDRPDSGNPIENFKADCLLSEIDFPCATECCDGKNSCCLSSDPDCKPEKDDFGI